MSTHSLGPEVEMCSLWGTVCTANVRGKSQGEECLVLSAVKCVCVCGPYLDVLERFLLSQLLGPQIHSTPVFRTFRVKQF
jgi:hypothetical protein